VRTDAGDNSCSFRRILVEFADARKKAHSCRIVRVQPSGCSFESPSPKQCLRKCQPCDSRGASTASSSRGVYRRERMDLAWHGLEAGAA
jgi:hypothetical protein